MWWFDVDETLLTELRKSDEDTIWYASWLYELKGLKVPIGLCSDSSFQRLEILKSRFSNLGINFSKTVTPREVVNCFGFSVKGEERTILRRKMEHRFGQGSYPKRIENKIALFLDLGKKIDRRTLNLFGATPQDLNRRDDLSKMSDCHHYLLDNWAALDENSLGMFTIECGNGLTVTNSGALCQGSFDSEVAKLFPDYVEELEI